MKTYYIELESTLIYRAYIQAETEEKAIELAQSADKDEFFCEETASDIINIEKVENTEDWDIPLISK